MEKLLARFSKVRNNRLLNRIQMNVDIFHPAEQNVTKVQIKDLIKDKFKKSHVSLINVQKLFGGGRTKAIALVYDNEESMKKVEPERRLIRFEREALPPKDRKKCGKGKKEGRKVKKIKRHQLIKKRGTKTRQDKNLARKQAKKKKKQGLLVLR